MAPAVLNQRPRLSTRDRVVEPEAAFEPAADLSGSPAHLTEAQTDRIVSLFGEAEPTDGGRDLTAEQIDWSAAIQLIRDVGKKVRNAREFSQDITRRSQSLIQRSVLQAEEAEERARTAEAAIEAAERRADQAERRAAFAEFRIEQAEAAAHAARAAEAEAQAWMKRLYACLSTEFHGLAADQT